VIILSTNYSLTDDENGRYPFDGGRRCPWASLLDRCMRSGYCLACEAMMRLAFLGSATAPQIEHICLPAGLIAVCHTVRTLQCSPGNGVGVLQIDSPSDLQDRN
jgi:hypothetical protein